MRLSGLLAWGTLGLSICSVAQAEQAAAEQPPGVLPIVVEQSKDSQPTAGQSNAGQSNAGQSNAGETNSGQASAGQASAGQGQNAQPGGGQPATQPQAGQTPSDPQRLQKLEEEVARLRAEETVRNEELAKVLSELEQLKKAGSAAPTTTAPGSTSPAGSPGKGRRNKPQPAAGQPTGVRPAAIYRAIADQGTGPGNVPPMTPASEPRSGVQLGPILTRFDVASRFANNKSQDPIQLLQHSTEQVGLFRGRLFVDSGIWPSVNAELMVTTGGVENPAIPFLRYGRQDRAADFSLGRAFFRYQPLKNVPYLNFTFGKMFNPFWRGDFRNDEMIWDDDVNPEGLAVQTPITTNVFKNKLTFQNTFSYIIFGNPLDNKYIGINRDYDLLADQVTMAQKNLKLGFAYYAYRGLNSGLKIPSFLPQNSPPSADLLTPGTEPFLLRPPLQNTNHFVGYGGYCPTVAVPGTSAGEGARDCQGFVSDIFEIYNFTGQFTLPEVIKNKQFYILGDYAHNARVRIDKNGYAVVLGVRSKQYNESRQEKFGTFNAWYIYRDVAADAVLADYSDSDLGGGSNYTGYEVGGRVALFPNTSVQLRYFNFGAVPFGFKEKERRERIFFDVIRSF